MTVYLIRHGKTAGNLTGRYIGATTDEPLCSQGIAELQTRAYPAVQRVFVSPMKRCKQTASLLYPGVKQIVVPDLRECDFGEFENQNYLELAGNANYQKWIDSNGMLPFPGGESREEFQTRSVKAFEKLEQFWKVNGYQGQTAALVVHGGTIMSILEKVGIPKRSYYDFQTGNGEGYRLEGEDGSYQYEKICYTQ